MKERTVPFGNPESPPILSTRAGGLVRAYIPQHSHPHLCGPAARGAWGAGFQASYF